MIGTFFGWRQAMQFDSILVLGNSDLQDQHMISSNDFQPGVTAEWNNGVWQIIEAMHVKLEKVRRLCARKNEKSSRPRIRSKTH